MIELTKENWKILQKVQHYWNDKIKYRNDYDQYSKSDHWTVPAEIKGKCEGDCEDYACAKQQDLKDNHSIQGWLATCWCYPDKKGYHAVLIVRTNIGALVLDNRFKDVMRYKDLVDIIGYKFHKMEQENQEWYELV